MFPSKLAPLKTLSPPLAHKGVSKCPKGFSTTQHRLPLICSKGIYFHPFSLPLPSFQYGAIREQKACVLLTDAETPAHDLPPPWTASLCLFGSLRLMNLPFLILGTPFSTRHSPNVFLCSAQEIITSFLRPLLVHPTEKPNNQHPPPNNALTFTQHPICSLQNTPHSLWKCLLDSLTFVSSTLLVERPFMVAGTSPNWFAAIFSVWGKLFVFFLHGQMKEWIRGLNVLSYVSVESTGNHLLPLLTRF